MNDEEQKKLLNRIYQREWYRKHASEINEKRRAKVQCPVCEKLFNRSSLKKHRENEPLRGVEWNNNFL